MKKLFIIANWKSNKTIKEAEEWLHEFNVGFVVNAKQILLKNKEIIIAPAFTALEHAYYCSNNLKLPIKLAAQNISPFNDGSYTGEESARQIKELTDYAIIGHSERRSNFYEDSKMINKKITMARQYGLALILCVSDINQIQNSNVKSQNYSSKLKSNETRIIVAYEPLFAIGTGNPDTPENADSMGKKIKEILGSVSVLYGGSVTSLNVNSFTKMSNIDGVLVGNASLNPREFLEIIKNA